MLAARGSCLLLLAAFAPSAFAQVRIETWTTENGLPQNSVNDIIQTRDGYLWLATFGGLVRFDGVRFVVFDRSVDGIESQRVRALLEHSDGTLWAATADGMLIRHRDGAFMTFGRADGLPGAEALRIDEDADGALWVTWVDPASHEGIVTKHDGRGVEIYRRGDLPDEVAPGPLHQGQSDIWWSRDSAGLSCLLRGRVIPCVPGEALPPGDVMRVVTDDRDNIWVVMNGSGVLKVSPGGSHLYSTKDDGLGDDAITLFFEDRQGTVWFAVRDGDLFAVRGAARELVASVVGLALVQDHEGSIWVGSALGLHRVRQPAIAMLAADGLFSNLVYSVLQDRAGAVWIGTWGGGVKRYEEGRSTSYQEAQGLPSGLVTSLYEDTSGRLWVGTMNGLTFMEGNRFRRYREGTALDGAVWAIHEDRTGTRWFATDRGLLSLRGERLDEYTSVRGLPHDRVTALAEGRSGALWIGTFQGLARLENGVLTAYTERDGFVGNWVRAFHEDADRAMWIGTYDGGLYRFKDDKLTRFTTRDGLHDNGVFQILEDDFGYFWMGSNRGISRVSRQELNDFAEGRISSVRTRVFGIRDGMTSLECNGGRHPAGLKAADGRLWFPTMGGAAVVDPRAVRMPPAPPSAIIEGATVQGAPADVRAEVTVPYDATSFEIRFTAPSFTNPERMRFRHRLLGLDERWVASSNERAATYHRLPPGRYEFVAAAAHEDGEWGAESTPIVLVVLAPFWRQPWFLGLVVALVIASAVAVDRRRVARHRRERARQAAFAQRLIATQEAERQRISTELHDSLGQDLYVIRANARAARDGGWDPVRGAAALGAIEDVARKASQDLKEATQALRPYHLDKIGLTASIARMLEAAEDASGIRFAGELEPIDVMVEADHQIHLYRIVQESVTNVMRHSGATHATVIVRRVGAQLELRIEDNGRGFRTDAVDGARAGEGGMGLMAIRERARSLGGDAQVRSRPGAGTAVVVTIPTGGGRHDR